MTNLDTLRVLLYEAGSTGYTWVYNTQLTPDSDLDMIKTTYRELPGEGLGGGGKRTFIFEPTFDVFADANQDNFPKSQFVQLIYIQPWMLDQILLPDGTIDAALAEQLEIEYFLADITVEITLGQSNWCRGKWQ
ncbi:hypothetical protein FGO68_gene7503 [Halteria grandinella]|uniref:Proteinase inhibitor I42 chagasin domain-containing protein n=1 Tax=Halteria grandinella TaxID=5974 RepID=A0A8J8SYA5_HALGN|nr:hypothetical protein FGO68_gene7503 [Halteria grandinella]